MGIIKSKPKISLLMQPEMHPGGAYSAQVVMQARREVPVDWINVRIDGEERATIGAGEGQRTLRRRLLSLGAKLCGERTLPSGRTELAFRFEIPPGLPPTYRGRSCTTEYVATVHASIPWWPDAKGTFEMFLSLPPPQEVKPEPVLFSSDPSGPAASEPHVEGSLASAVIAPGDVVEGALALNNVAANAYTSVEVGLVGWELVKGPGTSTVRSDALRYGLEISLATPVEGASIPFRFRVPGKLAPSHEAGLWTLSWAFEVRVKIRWGSDLWFRVPVVVVPGSTGHGRQQLDFRAPPSVGSERVEKVWRSVAAELGLSTETGTLRGVQGEVEYEVRREHRGRLGVFLVARLTYPSLHLGLCVEPRRSVLGRWDRQVVLDAAVWGARHCLKCRDHGQGAAIGGQLGPAIRLFQAVRMDDDEALVERQGSGQRRQKLIDFVTAVRTLAAAIDRARAAIPPPAALAVGVDQWRAFAAQLGGSLETARMVVRGHFHAMPVEARTEWSGDGRPERTLLTLVPNASIAAENEIHVSAAEDPAIAPGRIRLAQAPLSASARPLVEAIAKGALSFDLTGQELRLSLPAPLLDPSPLAERLVQMTQLCELVRSAKGPFR
jgi:hypothetical protein